MKSLPVVGDVMQGVGSIQQGLAANAAGKYTRKVMRVNARNTHADGMMEADRIRAASAEAMGRQLVAQGGSGFAMGTGSALDALRESAINRELDLATVRRSTTMKANNFIQEGSLAREKGRAEMWGGFISGAGSFMNAAASAFGGGSGGAAGAAAAGGGAG